MLYFPIITRQTILNRICHFFIAGEELIGLDTVKKGTPLYGQPDWWGDDKQEGKKGKILTALHYDIVNMTGSSTSLLLTTICFCHYMHYTNYGRNIV